MKAYRLDLQTSVGEAVGQVAINVDGDWMEIIPAKNAASQMGYSLSRIRALLDSGKLIGINVNRRWWVTVESLERQAQRIGRDVQPNGLIESNCSNR